MQYLDGARIAERVDFPTLIAGLRRLHCEDTEALQDLLLEQPAASGDTDRFFLRAAWQRGRALGAKVITIFPDNPKQSDKPSIQAVYLLFDGRYGSPRLALDGTMLTWLKTAADSALGASFLARDDAATLLMVGAGAMAPHLIRAHRAARPSLRRLLLWNRSRARAERLAEQMATEGIAAEVVDDLGSAAATADIISCATMSASALIQGDWLRPGSHLDLVGAYTPQMREADDQALRRGTLFVDSRQTALDTGELGIPLASGVISADTIQADLFQLSRGQHPGRRSADQITVYKNGGGGHLDLMCARLIEERLTAPS